jgi:hypothetical protein
LEGGGEKIMEGRLSLALQVVTVILLGLILLRVGAVPQATTASTPPADFELVLKKLDRLLVLQEAAENELRAICNRLPAPSVSFGLNPDCAVAGP